LSFLVAVALSWLTFRFVEIPLRQQKNAAPKLAFGLVRCRHGGIVTVIASGFGFRFPWKFAISRRLAPHSNAGFRDKCFLGHTWI
jgi:peptidoglycan/LPS O-acetylase OafA/YrhL